MRRTSCVLAAALACAPLLVARDAGDGKISGTYVEVRSNDVYVGACYANAEIGLVGREGTMAWNIGAGTFGGVRLDGLSMVAVVLASSTLGDPFISQYPIRSVLILDEKASAEQRAALRALARKVAGRNLGTVVREEIVPIRFETGQCDGDAHAAHLGGSAPACARVTAGTLVALQTRNLSHSDNICANAELFYQPLTGGLKGATPVFAQEMVFRGAGLGAQWSIPNKRGGFVAALEVDTRSLDETRR